ncbi:hypothetical protein [Nocardioides caricicola]|uniref:WD40 repeat domain-containing protein n=1 Tax=Nocardioides caricicola TaxID=634770 RepID=A0ABW0MZC1_9ACTN
MITALVSALLVTLSPAALPAGPHPAGPHVDGRVLHDDAVRISLDADRVGLLGTAGDRYVVRLSSSDGSDARIVSVRPDGRERLLTANRDASASPLLSDDGRHLISTPHASSSSTTVRVRSARTGRVLVTRTFPGSVSVLDASSGRAVLGGWAPNRTFWWTYAGTDDTTPINRRTGYFASIEAGRVASYTRDPYQGGCSVLTSLAGNRLSRSCTERVAAVSPDGRRVAAIGILSDGIGPSRVTVRRATGDRLDRYDAPYFFGSIRWESDTALLMDTYDQRRWATVRCDLSDCERASKLRRTPRY